MAASSSLKEYLKRYTSDDQIKKKKKKKPNPTPNGVLILDEDPVWQKPIQIEDPDSDSSADESKPLVEEDIEVKRMKRLQAIAARKPYHAISDDGSGWVPISHTNPSASSPPDLSPPRRRGPDSNPRDGDGDLSPPRHRGGRPPRPPAHRKRLDSMSPEPDAGGGDLSPPRKSRRESPPCDLSPPRRRQSQETPASSVRDLSPPRRRQTRSSETSVATEDLSLPRDRGGRPPRPPARRKRLDSMSPEPDAGGGDLSPPRKSRRESPPGDLSPPRRRQSQENLRARESSTPAASVRDLSPPRRRQSQENLRGRESSTPAASVRDLSPPRRRQSQENLRGRESSTPAASVRDLSPPRRRQSRSGEPSAATEDHSPPRRSSRGPSRLSSDADLSPARKRKVEAPKTGLLSAKELKEENIRKKEEEVARYKTMDPALLGKGAEPVFRKEGKRISKEELLKEQEEQKPKEKKIVWGKGLAQQREAEAMAEDMELEKEKPFARTRDDPDLDKMLKERLRWGDPMAHLVKQKHSEFLLEDLGDDEKMKESGFIVPQTIPKHSWIKRGLDWPPNRYGIRPGRHWDGVDRSTGYEKEMFKRQNEKKATETEAYLWSVSDM